MASVRLVSLCALEGRHPSSQRYLKKNLMYYMMDGHVVGVLNDCDLTSVVSSPGRLGNERTGTIPFVAIELLRPDGQAGEVEHIYRHDMESLIWVFVWLCFQYKDGKSNHGPLDVWAKVDASLCVTKKLAFLHSDMGEPSHLNYAHQFRLTRFYDFLDSTFRPRRSRRMYLEDARSFLAEAPNREDLTMASGLCRCRRTSNDLKQSLWRNLTMTCLRNSLQQLLNEDPFAFSFGHRRR